MQLLKKNSSSDSISLSNRIINKAQSQKKFKNYFKPKPELNLNLAPLTSTNEGTSYIQGNTFSNKSVRIRKTLSKGSFNLKSNVPKLLTSRKKISVQFDPIKKFQKELNDYEKEEIFNYNEIYYAGTKGNKIEPIESEKNFGYDNESGNYRLVKGDHICYRYEIIAYIGKGSFGIVCECYDHKHKNHVAIKILKNKKSFHRQGEIEINILQILKENDPENHKGVVKLKNNFIFRNHIVLVFDLLSLSLYDYLKLSHFKGLKLKQIMSYAKELLISLVYLESLSIIHCDIKPENLLLNSSSCKNVTLIDFGSSCFTNRRIHSYIQSRYYRSPEVILGIPYTTSIDM